MAHSRNMDLGERIKAARLAPGRRQSQETLARRLGVHVRSVQYWESGTHPAAEAKLERLEEALGLTPGNLTEPDRPDRAWTPRFTTDDDTGPPDRALPSLATLVLERIGNRPLTEAARESGVGRMTLHRIREGVIPDDANLARLAPWLGVSHAELREIARAQKSGPPAPLEGYDRLPTRVQRAINELVQAIIETS